MSSNTSGSVDGCSSDRATRMPSIPSFASAKTTRWSSAVSVAMRSIVLVVLSPEKKNCVRSCIRVLPPGSTQSLSVTSSPRSAPDFAETIRR